MDTASRSSSALPAFIKQHPSVKYVRLQWVDFCGILRVRVLTKKYALELALSQRPLVVTTMTFEGLFNGGMFFNTSFVGTDELFPDWNSSLKLAVGRNSERSHFASVMCNVYRKPKLDPNLGWKMCPRVALGNAIVEAREKYGIEHLVGFEVEFAMLRKGEGFVCPQPLEKFPGISAATSLRTRSFDILKECMDELTEAGVAIQQFHPEGIDGQFEFSLAPLPPLEAVDTLIFVHDTIKTILSRHDCLATVYPIGFARLSSNSCHTHISINPPDREEEYLAGVLKNLPKLCAFGMPSYHSYTRMGQFEAGSWVGWGTEDKSMPARKVSPGHWEFRAVDASCNMYLTVAAYISAGLVGLEDKEKLTIKDSAHFEDGALQSEEIRSKLGIVSKLPTSLKQSISQLEGDDSKWAKKVGLDLIKRYLDVKREEVKITEDAKDDDELKALYLRFH